MMYILWALLNIGLFIFIIIICFNATKIVKQKLGILVAIIFALALLSFIGRSNSNEDNKEPNSKQLKTWNFYPIDSLDMNSHVFVSIDLEKTSISTYRLGIVYGKGKHLDNNFPISANSWTTGLQSGTSWVPSSIIITRTEDNHRFNYDVSGTIKWKLMGITIFSQSKQWKGVVLLR